MEVNALDHVKDHIVNGKPPKPGPSPGTKGSVSLDGSKGKKMTWHCITHLKPNRASFLTTPRCASKHTLVW